jgi:extracellular elastinolytic metalloproteinase
MSREIDLRDFAVSRATGARRAELHSRALDASAELPGSHRLSVDRFDPLTGNPSRVVSESAPAQPGNYVQRALDHVQRVGRALGLEAGQANEFVADPNYQRTSSGAVAVHLQQQYKGIAIFQAAEVVHFAPDGAISETVGSSVSVAQDTDVAPRLPVTDAVRRAAEHVATPDADEYGGKDQFGEPQEPVGVDLASFVPRVVATLTQHADQTTLLEPGPFGEQIKARLIWFALGEQLRLAWEVILTLPRFAGQYRTLVDARDGSVLYCRQLVRGVAARGNVYRVDGAAGRQWTDFPRPLADYGVPIPAGLPGAFPDHWVSDGSTRGNSTNAHLGDSGPVLQGTGAPVVQFDPADASGDDQKVLNIFYYNCQMHDFFYLLGFREADGNFQHDNFGRGGIASDRVDARAHSGAVWGTANMATPVDGRTPIMNMGLVTSTGRHTAFDSSVVFHEFTHGVTNRLVGGPLNDHALDAPQSGGMGEGWSDYVACSVNGSIVVGDWVVGNPGGIRDFPYDTNFPDTFADLGSGRYSEVHNIGEIWCATLMELNRRVGRTLMLQLVVDALKLTPANPSFLDARDAILRALDDRLAAGQIPPADHVRARDEAWKVFARFGMGPRAQSNGASLSGIVGDFQPPAGETQAPTRVQVGASPNLAIPDNNPGGVRNRLNVTQAGQISGIAVAVDITHSYIGDLTVALVAPSGGRVVLHARSGARTRDLKKTYSDADTPGLATLRSQQAQGEWTLEVADHAAIDVGVLRNWNLTLDLAAPASVIRSEATPGTSIPDNAPAGITSAIAVSGSGTVRAIKVGVDITHTYIGDLRVELIGPTGRSALLHDRSGRDRDNIIATYTSAAQAGLAAFVGQSVQGAWTLRVADLAGRDVGKLNRWELEITL